MNIKNMDIVREYGRPPFRAIVLHGGPGAPGCAAGLCRGAAERGIPVLEHLQTADTFVGLMEEILSIMKRYSMEQTILIGHSFGSWLAWCFAEKYPSMVQKIILAGGGPLEAKYLQDIIRTRNERKSQGIEDTDNYCALPGTSEDMLFFNKEQYEALMAEAFALRESGDLLKRALRVQCPVTLIQGDYDPHPAEGVYAPLAGRLPQFSYYILEKCGHDPWKEKYARTRFLDLLEAEVNYLIKPAELRTSRLL